MDRTRLATLVVLFALATAGFGSGTAAAELALKIGTFDPTVEQPTLPDDLRLPAEPESGYFVVQFDRAIEPRLLDGLRSLGVEPLGYLPERAYLVRLPRGAASAVRAVPDVRWLGPVQPGWKLAADLGTRPFQDPSRRVGGRLYATADLFPGADPASVIAAAQAAGAEVIQLIEFARTRRLKLRATPDQLREIARSPAVMWIEELGEITLRNNTTRWVVQTDVQDATTIWDHGIRGQNQIAGLIDNRMDMNACYFRDDADNTPGPNHRKVVAYRSNSGLGAASHGTHTAGTIAGDQFPINGTIDNNGTAYEARLSFSNLSDISGSGTQVSNLYDYLSDAHLDGARVHSNSWGDDGTTAYTTWCVDIDQFSYDFEESLVLFAETNTSSLRTPENAKNVLAVAASQNGLSNDNHCSGGRGPTSDGRHKPEIYAPGCSIVSARNSALCSTRSSTGTSMACPAVTASGALVRQYYEEGWYPTGTPRGQDARVPSGALVKATLLNSTVDMTGMSGYPGTLEGWGRVLLENALFFDGDVRSTSVMADVLNADGLSTAEQVEHSLTVTASAEPLKITLVFTDPPASLLAEDAAINDLDLEVVAPSGATYLGNAIDTAAGESTTGGAADAINNVEMVIRSSPEVGEWTVRVKATAVNQGTQGYALVASGQVEPFTPGQLRYESHAVQDDSPLGNDDGIVDPGETATLPLTLGNNGSLAVSAISAALSSNQGELVKLTEDVASFPDIAPDTAAQSLPPHYRFTVSPDATCGTQIRFTALTASSEGEGQTTFTVDIGNNRLDGGAGGLPLTIPKRATSGVASTLEITSAFTIQDVQCAVDITHGDVGELRVVLTSPSGTEVTLHNLSGAGTADIATVFDRDRQPDGPGSMGDFDGEPAQGTWTLTVFDESSGPTPPGSLDAWSLELRSTTPLSCTPLACVGDPVPSEVSDGVTVDKENGSDLRLSWDPLAGAAGYRIWKSASPAFETEQLVGSTADTTFVELGGLLDGEAWNYQVRAVNSCEWEGP